MKPEGKKTCILRTYPILIALDTGGAGKEIDEVLGYAMQKRWCLCSNDRSTTSYNPRWHRRYDQGLVGELTKRRSIAPYEEM